MREIHVNWGIAKVVLEIARPAGLVATMSEGQTNGAAWVVLADPEGNEFCVEPG